MKPAALILFFALICACNKKHEINNLHVQILNFSARQGHIYNIFALDRLHTHSYIAVTDNQDHPWSFTINSVDILGETGELIIDPVAASAIVINESTTTTVTFSNLQTRESKTVELTGAKFSIDFDNAAEAQELMHKSREDQRGILKAFAMDASSESFNVATH